MHEVSPYSSSTTMASYSSSSSSSSSLASQSHPWRHDVFLNFRGEDTRRNFICHLYDALSRKGLQTYIDEDELPRGEEISPSLLQAIEHSNAAVVVFSKDYASSTWCLNELAKIVECHQTREQIVIPVFYDVIPSHLRNQSDDVATAFETHEQNPKNAHKIQNWRDALKTTADLSGLDSKNFRNDHILISEIVEEISRKLMKSTIFNGDQQLFGVDSRFQEIMQALSIKGQESLDVCFIGIWGMGGIGKTTIAEFIFKRLSSKFEGCCFLKNVREASKVRDLKKELISQLLGEKEPNVYAFPETRLGRRRALIVLDDVDDSQQLESLIGDPCWFGSRSVIIITGRDKQLLERWAEFLYEVKPLKDKEALQLFSTSAFKQNYPKNDYKSLSSSIVKYAQGNPLALKVLGSSLYAKTTKEWESALEKLSKCPNKNIQDVLQRGYDLLDRMEKDIFLHIACFLKGVSKDVVMTMFKSIYKADVDIVVSNLANKCFVTVYFGTLEMHDLMQEMGKEIVRQESKHLNQRSRLWDPEDVIKVLAEDKVAEKVESIILDMSKMSKKIDLNPEVFMKIPNLKFLKFYVPDRQNCFEGRNNVQLPQGLDYLPNELTYFYWDGYPLESFPCNFRPNHLIVLRLPNSKIKRFGKEVRDFGTVLRHFGRLIKIPSYIYGWQLGKVTSLSLVDCKSISHLPSSGVGLLEAVEILILEGCKNLDTFPEVSSNIKVMDLSETAVKQIPSSSVEHLAKLECLIMSNCDKLESLPSNFFDALTSLGILLLYNCRSLKKLPEISENNRLRYLDLGGTELELPSSFGNLKGLKTLSIGQCPKLTFVPKSEVNLASLENLYLWGPTSNHHPVIDVSFLSLLLENTSSLYHLHLDSLNLREPPKNWSCLSSLTELRLTGNNFERIPAAIKQLSNLHSMYISHCQRLISLPEFPWSLTQLIAHNCTSLEQIRTLKQLILESKSTLKRRRFCLWNCLKLDEDECQEVADLPSGFCKTRVTYEMRYPGIRIPKWVQYQNMGDSVEVPNISHWINQHELGVILCVCFKSITNGLRDEREDLWPKFDCYFGDNYFTGTYIGGIDCYHLNEDADKEHVLFFSCAITFRGYRSGDVALFKFRSKEKHTSIEILKCGVTPFYLDNEFPTPLSTVKIEEVEEAVVADSKVRK